MCSVRRAASMSSCARRTCMTTSRPPARGQQSRFLRRDCGGAGGREGAEAESSPAADRLGGTVIRLFVAIATFAALVNAAESLASGPIDLDVPDNLLAIQRDQPDH